MLLNSTHRSWLIATILFLAAGAALYCVEVFTSPVGPRGDTWIGLTLGVIATAFVLYPAALGIRKKFLVLRIGSITWWMKGHLWLGLASLPFALFHGAFCLGGRLTTILLILLIFVVLTGVIGAALQHFLPRAMTAEIEAEHTYEQLDRVRWNLRLNAYEAVAGVCGRVAEADEERCRLEAFFEHGPREAKKPETVVGDESLREFYVTTVVPFLCDGSSGRSALRRADQAAFVFDETMVVVDPSRHDVIGDLSAICKHARELNVQAKLHRWLHGWLLLHIPMSAALIVLLAVHAVMALYY
ncbi:MAG: hypothetical protein AABZ47_02840 [Planctomycetota bacterium]